jgi:hypothetical protein
MCGVINVGVAFPVHNGRNKQVKRRKNETGMGMGIKKM